MGCSKKNCKCNLCRDVSSFKIAKLFNMTKKTDRNFQNASSKPENLDIKKLKEKSTFLKRRSSFLENEQYSKSMAENFNLNGSKLTKKSLSCTEIWNKTNHQGYLLSNGNENVTNVILETSEENNCSKTNSNEIKKTVIYFGDSISNKRQQMYKSSVITVTPPEISEIKINVQNHNNLHHENELNKTPAPNSMQKDDWKINGNPKNAQDMEILKKSESSAVMMEQLKVVLKEKCNDITRVTVNKVVTTATEEEISLNYDSTDKNKSDEFLQKHVESNVDSMENINMDNNNRNDFISIKIKNSYDLASKLVKAIESNDCANNKNDNYNEFFLDVGGEVNNVYFDWSFVQDWRSR